MRKCTFTEGVKPRKGRIPVIGVGGGTSAGKTTLVNIFGNRGWAILDLDHEARRLSRKGGSIWKALLKEFGPVILRRDGNLDRKKLGWFAFKKRKNLLHLNCITHLFLLQETRKIIARTQEKGLVVDGAVLYEGGFLPLLDMIIYVEVNQEERVRRICQKGLSDREARRRVKGQFFLPSLRRRSSIVLQNCESREHWRRITEDLLNMIEKQLSHSREE